MIGQSLRPTHDRQCLKGRQKPVTCAVVIEENNVTRLLTAEVEAPLPHRHALSRNGDDDHSADCQDNGQRSAGDVTAGLAGQQQSGADIVLGLFPAESTRYGLIVDGSGTGLDPNQTLYLVNAAK